LTGNINLSVIIITVSLLVSIVIAPLWANLLIGTFIQVPVLLIIKYLAMIIIIPLMLAHHTRIFIIRKKGLFLFNKIKEGIQIMVGFGLMLLLFIIFVINGKLLVNDPVLILRIIFPASFFLIILLICSIHIAKIANFFMKIQLL